MDPRAFFDMFVLPTIDEWRFASMDVRIATLAICQLDILAERTVRHANPGIADKAFRTERERLAEIEPALALVRDIHDAHKHGPLVRKNAVITRDQRPEIHAWGGGIGAAPVGGAPIGGTIYELVIREDNGTRHELGNVVNRSVAYWIGELDRLGL